MIVIDTNLLAAVLLDGPQQAVAQAVLARDAEWWAPPLWRSELRNVLARVVRRSGMASSAAVMMCVRAQQLVDGREGQVDDAAVLQHAVASGCTAYDCEFVVLAEVLGVPLVTFDQQVLSAFPATAIHPDDFASESFWNDRVSEALQAYAGGVRAIRRRSTTRRVA